MVSPRASFLALDYRALFESSLDVFLVLGVDLVIVAVSEGYCRLTKTKPAAILGRELFEVFPHNSVMGSDAANSSVRISLNRVLQNRGADSLPIHEYKLNEDSISGKLIQKYLSIVTSPVLPPSGENLTHIIHRLEDVTELTLSMQRESEERKLVADLKSRVVQMAADIEQRSQDYQVAETEKGRAEKARILAEEEKGRAEVAKKLAEEERKRAEVAKNLAEEEKGRAEVAVKLAHEEKLQAEKEKKLAQVAKRFAEEEKKLAETTRIVAEAAKKVADEDKKQAEIAKKIAEDEKKRADEEKCRADAANSELETFSYSVAHDLRSPLRGIDGFSQVLLEDYGEKLDAAGKDYLLRIRLGCQRMGTLIDDLLNLAKISRSELQLRIVDLSAMVHIVAKEFRLTDPSRRVEFRIQEDIVGNGDVGLLQVVMQNLIGNAWKYSSKKDESLIEFGHTQEKGESIYFVRDNGAGFDMAYADKLFGVFQRLHSKQDFAGTGVGLATVRRIISRHGGRIWADGSVDKGAVFYFNLG